MADLLQQGSDWLEQMRTQHCSSQVEYRRDAQVAGVNATFGKTDYEVADDYGLKIGASICDFLILAGDLGLEPEVGDVIAASGRKYEVLDFGSDGCWRWSDPYRTTMRIHTKDIGSDD